MQRPKMKSICINSRYLLFFPDVEAMTERKKKTGYVHIGLKGRQYAQEAQPRNENITKSR